MRAMREGNSPIGPACDARGEVVARGGGVPPENNGPAAQEGRHGAEGSSARWLREGGGDGVMGCGAITEYTCMAKGSMRVSDGGPE